jgi:hypothetical protein
MAAELTEGEVIVEGDGIPCRVEGLLRRGFYRGIWVAQVEFKAIDGGGVQHVCVPLKAVRVGKLATA